MSDKLSHLSSEQIENLINRYYEREKISDLIAEFKIDIKPSSLVSLFPPIIHEDLLCPYCANTNLITKRLGRGSASAFLSYPSCPKCGHDNNKRCFCYNCREETKKRQKELIAAKYSRQVTTTPVTALTLSDCLYLMALMRQSASEDLQFVEPYSGPPYFAPTDDLKNDIIKHLYSKELININLDSSVEAFEFDSSQTSITGYYPDRVEWEFLPSMTAEEKHNYLNEINKIIKGF